MAEPQAGRGSVAALPGIRPITIPRVSDEVAEQIRQLILTERLGEGERLPAERELAERFAVSRPMISQALRMLSLMGLVEIRRGSGAYVLRRPQAMVTASVGLMLDFDHGSLADLAQLRLWLETLGSVNAATREPGAMATDADLRGALTRLTESTTDAATWIAADTLFHATVVARAGNPYLTAVYESVHSAVLSHEYDHWVRTEAAPSWLSAAQSGTQIALHQAIADAVMAGDQAGATIAVARHHKAMLEHLAAVRSET